MFDKTLTEHWNGSTWKVVFSPNIGTNGDSLHGIAAVTASNIWAVGEYGTKDRSGQVVGRTLIEHWDGNQWKAASLLTIGIGVNILQSVTTFSAHNIWAVGYYFDRNNVIKTLIAHWNGAKWKIVSSPNPGSRENLFNGLAGAGNDDVWAVGLSINTVNEHSRTLIEFYDA